MSNLLLNNLASAISGMQSLQRVETPAACLTLTRSATLAITTAGTTITWQVETRANGITWSGTTITIPTTGYYGVTLTYASSLNHTALVQCIVNGIVAPTAMAYSGANITDQVFFLMRYFTTGDAVQIRVIPSANQTIAVNAEGAQNESPFVHVVQLTGSQT